MVLAEAARLGLHMRSQGRQLKGFLEFALYIWSRMSVDHVTLSWTTSTGRE